MNEIVAIVYLCFTGWGKNELIDDKYIESDVFCAFSNLMTDLRDGFIREVEAKDSGIQGHINNYKAILEYSDPEILYSIEENNVNHHFYTLRWFMLLLCQEFKMDDILRLWDSIFAADVPGLTSYSDASSCF